MGNSIKRRYFFGSKNCQLRILNCYWTASKTIKFQTDWLFYGSFNKFSIFFIKQFFIKSSLVATLSIQKEPKEAHPTYCIPPIYQRNNNKNICKQHSYTSNQLRYHKYFFKPLRTLWPLSKIVDQMENKDQPTKIHTFHLHSTNRKHSKIFYTHLNI